MCLETFPPKRLKIINSHIFGRPTFPEGTWVHIKYLPRLICQCSFIRLISQTPWYKHVYGMQFLQRVDHQSWLWFPPGDLFVTTKVSSCCAAACKTQSFFLFQILWITSFTSVWVPMTCPVKGLMGSGFLILLVLVATNPAGATFVCLADFKDVLIALAGVGGPKRLLKESAEAFVRLVGFEDGCSSPSWKLDAILSINWGQWPICPKLGIISCRFYRTSPLPTFSLFLFLIIFFVSFIFSLHFVSLFSFTCAPLQVTAGLLTQYYWVTGSPIRMIWEMFW